MGWDGMGWEGRAFHSLVAVGEKLFPNVSDECLI